MLRTIVSLATVLLTGSFSTMAHSAATLVYIGTQGPTPSMGIASAEFDSDTGTLSAPKLIEQTPDPAFMALNPSGSHLYLCNTGTPGGVSAFAIERSSGALRLLNHKASTGRGPSHIGLDKTGNYVLDANYGGGFVEIHARENDGSLGNRTAFVQHTGHSIHPERQTKPYAHWFGVDPSNRFALAADLGTDRIVIYGLNTTDGSLTPHDPPFTSVRAGSGPRHIAWHPNGRYAYAIQELSNEIIVFSWDSSKGALEELQTVPTLPASFKDASTAAEIAVHANGKFLYTSNRGHDSIASFAVDPQTGKLTALGHVSSQGKTPRFFAFDPTHRWLIVNNQDSGDIVVFAVDPSSGRLQPQPGTQKLEKPMGIVFVK